MTQDANKYLQVSQYNYLNLPQQISSNTDATNEINFLYDATGIKLRKQTKINNAPEKTLDYIGSFVYENLVLKYILTNEGRVMVNSDRTYEYQYFLKDHFGNTRVTFNENGGIIQEDTYYPFGMQMNGLCYETGEDYKNKYLYNGKELQDEFGLDWYDYGARMYDAQLGKWHVPDPMCEILRRWTTYQYAYNNPIRFIDPDGMIVDDYFNNDGIYLGSDEAKTDNVKIMEQKDWDANRTVDSDGTESIDNTLGESLSSNHSESGISEEASLSVYNHYNPTDLSLEAKKNETGSGGMTFHATKKNGKTSERIDIKLEGNKKNKFSDHANEITNLFEHEKQHYEDYKSIGFDAYKKTSKNRTESRAVSNQMKHSSFKGTRTGYQKAVKSYGLKHGMLFPIKPRTVIIIN